MKRDKTILFKVPGKTPLLLIKLASVHRNSFLTDNDLKVKTYTWKLKYDIHLGVLWSSVSGTLSCNKRFIYHDTRGCAPSKKQNRLKPARGPVYRFQELVTIIWFTRSKRRDKLFF